ncbi:MAG: galactose-1-phosphate uridylyltransferase [Armatimonadetes bacterium RBG_16_58_9]|nr:MAG: galactose-1-phosphate uridylyltransferase [Armatimonadetes bacterium RBG_16_58_9]
MSELRWHPLLEEWVITATHRQDRTFLPPDDYCPLCPTKPGSDFPTEIPAPDYEVVTFENRFPSLQHPPPEPAVRQTQLYKVRPADGICEVVCYTARHKGTLTDVSLQEMRNLVEVWTDRFSELGERDFVEYVLIFENKGVEIGVTLHHPHGQIYAFPFVPPKIQRELKSASNHMKRTGRCLLCDIIGEEIRDGRRIVIENDSFVAVIPFFARYPYETYVMPRAHHPTMLTFDDSQRDDLANILKAVLLKYDNLWGTSLPYMMIMHQAPTDGRDYGYYHYHIEFHPPNRTSTKLKYLAGCEAGAGSFINDAAVEKNAEELRRAEPSTVECTRLKL